MIEVNIKLENGGYIPAKSTVGAAAYDLYAPADYRVKPGRQIMPLNFRIGIPYGYEGHIQSRSGYAAKGMEGYKIVSSKKQHRFDCDLLEGKIDSDYTGIVGAILNNHDKPFWIKKGTRIGQMTFRQVEDAKFCEVGSLEETERGEGGYGSTNK